MKKALKITSIFHAVIALVWIACATFPLFVPGSANAASIGIIGGADGPTAVFVAGSTISSGLFTIIASLSLFPVSELLFNIFNIINSFSGKKHKKLNTVLLAWIVINIIFLWLTPLQNVTPIWAVYIKYLFVSTSVLLFILLIENTKNN